ncbi:MAG: PAS domain S-box protein, partial [Haliea sp.]
MTQHPSPYDPSASGRHALGAAADTADLQQLHFATAFEEAAIGMALIDPHGRYERVNRALCEMLGYTHAEMLTRVAHDMTHPQDVDEGRRHRESLMSGQKNTYHREKRFIHKDGRVIWTHLTCTLVRDRQGAPLRFIIQIEDISERKQAERALRASEERFRSLTMLTSDWFWEQDANFCFTVFSGGERAGYPDLQHDPSIGKRPWEIEGAIPVSTPWEAHRAVLEARIPFHDFEYRRGEGADARYFSVSGEPVCDEDGRFAGYRGTAREITESRRAALEMRTVAQRLTTTLESLTDAFFTVDLAWNFSYLNARAERLLGKLRPELLGQHIWSAFPDFAAGALRDHFERAVNEGVAVQFDEHYQPTGLWTQIKAYPSSQGLAVYVRDVTERVNAQREILRLNAELEGRVRQRTAELEAANKEMESFSYSIAHDLRAPLGSIDGFSQMLEQAAGGVLDERGQHCLRRIRAGVRRMGELTDGLLALSSLSRANLRREPVDLAVLARDALAALREQAPQREVEVQVAASLPAMGDSRLLAQVMGNLVGNAWKFTAHTPGARIEVGSTARSTGSRLR